MWTRSRKLILSINICCAFPFCTSCCSAHTKWYFNSWYKMCISCFFSVFHLRNVLLVFLLYQKIVGHTGGRVLSTELSHRPPLGFERLCLSKCFSMWACVCVHMSISVCVFVFQLLATVLSQSVKAKEHLLEQSQSVEQSASKHTHSYKHSVARYRRLYLKCSFVSALI